VTTKIGILTTGGDSPGTNAVIRAIGKASRNQDTKIIGFQDGFSGMADNLSIELAGNTFSGILTKGGTLLGTNRDLPDRMLVEGKPVDRTQEIVQVYKKNRLDCLVCLGGGGAQISAQILVENGLNIVTIPVTIDNDIPQTDTSVGFDTALEIAAEAIDRLHSTAISHHRIIIVEIMGRESGWLTLGAGMAGGADVILVPEIPYDFNKISTAILERSKGGKRFSLVAVSEGAISLDSVQFFDTARRANIRLRAGRNENDVAHRLDLIEKKAAGDTLHLANQLEKFTGV
jgi:6-phosphofructokinase